MTAAEADLKTFRHRLGLTQAEMAAPLGVSKRALQSYEQGWRPVPMHVWERVALLLFLQWRRGNRGAVRACWQVRGCSLAARRQCPAARMGAGELCWMVCGPMGGPMQMASGGAESFCWEKCPVAQEWFKG